MNKEGLIYYLFELISLTNKGEQVSKDENDDEEIKAYTHRREAYQTVKDAVESGSFDTETDKPQVVYLVSRRIEGENEDASHTIKTTLEKAVQWIEEYGRDWENRDYFFVVMSMIVDLENEHQPIDELYFYDQYGKMLDRQPFYKVHPNKEE